MAGLDNDCDGTIDGADAVGAILTEQCKSLKRTIWTTEVAPFILTPPAVLCPVSDITALTIVMILILSSFPMLLKFVMV